MRLWVRPGVRVILCFGFSRAIECIPDAPKNETLGQLPPLSPVDRLPGISTVDEKRQPFLERSTASPNSVVLPDCIHIPVEETYPHCLSKKVVGPRLNKPPVPLRTD